MEFAEIPRGRGGFTLVEVMVAITISTLLLLGAHAMVEQVGASAEQISATAADADREANAERVLRDLIGRAEQPQAGSEFTGTPLGARFSSWCEVAAGWLERCTVSLGIVRVGGANVLVIEVHGGTLIPLRRGFADGSVLYLRDAADGGRWLREWSSAVAAPVALGIVMDADTLILRLGERG
jgi:prepilin-type N-terminal cleavage/methylation domain-containing protein